MSSSLTPPKRCNRVTQGREQQRVVEMGRIGLPDRRQDEDQRGLAHGRVVPEELERAELALDLRSLRGVGRVQDDFGSSVHDACVASSTTSANRSPLISSSSRAALPSSLLARSTYFT